MVIAIRDAPPVELGDHVGSLSGDYAIQEIGFREEPAAWC
jgi:hypothetical protein